MKYNMKALKSELKLWSDCEYPLPYGGYRSYDIVYWTGVRCGKAMLAREILKEFFGVDCEDK